MEASISQVVDQLTKQQIQKLVTSEVAEALTKKLEEDDGFADEFEMLVGEAIEQNTAIQTAPEPRFKTVAEFVDGFIRPMYPTTKTNQDRARWSKQWYTHPEVVARLSALWRIYERKRAADPNGFLEEFLRVNADYHMRQIMGEDSVFAQCSTRDTPSIPLPVEPAGEAGPNEEYRED